MKTFFSEYQYMPQLRGLKEIIPDTIWQDEIIKSRLEHPGSVSDREISTLISATQNQMLNRKGVDLFITTPELADSIVGMVKDYTPSVLDVFHEFKSSAIVIHPVSPQPAVLFGIRTFCGVTLAVFHEVGGQNKMATWLGEEAFLKNERLQPLGYADRLVIGLALYLRFFPSAIIDGLPDFAKHPSHYKNRFCRSVGMTETLIDRRGAKPHIRKAHFRFLTSDRFVKKKNTYVIVHESFVRGKCKIVVEVEGKD